MKRLLWSLALLSTTVFAGLDPMVWISGKLGNKFDDKEVKVTDSQGQTYMLPRKVFPKDFKFEQGASFNIEVHENELKNLKLMKK